MPNETPNILIDPPGVGRFEEGLPDLEEKSFQKQSPRPGLIPKSGDPQHPGRWIKPEQAEAFKRALPKLLDMAQTKEHKQMLLDAEKRYSQEANMNKAFELWKQIRSN